jgi:probable rRNA maturation factor
MPSLYVRPWRIDVRSRRGIPRLVPATVLGRWVAAALDAAGSPKPASVDLLLTDDAELATLNAKHMGKSGPTDVLSYPILPANAFPPHPGQQPLRAAGESFPLPPGVRQPLGDIVVSVERAIDQADAGRGGQTGDVRWLPADELRLLVTHGALHLCGWDHAEPAEESAMRALERRLLAG